MAESFPRGMDDRKRNNAFQEVLEEAVSIRKDAPVPTSMVPNIWDEIWTTEALFMLCSDGEDEPRLSENKVKCVQRDCHRRNVDGLCCRRLRGVLQVEMESHSMGPWVAWGCLHWTHQPGAVQVVRAYSRSVFRPHCGAGNCGLGRDAGSVHSPRGLRGQKFHFAGKRIRTPTLAPRPRR